MKARLSGTIALVSAAGIALSLHAIACAVPTTATPTSPKKWKAYFKQHNSVARESLVRDPAGAAVATSTLPTALSQTPWGGPSPASWKPEAIVANAASEALNDGWAEAKVKDVLVALPVKMESSTLRPYGDGQTNASINFGKGWASTQPPLVATLILFENGLSRLKFRVDPSLMKSKPALRLVYHLSGAPTSKAWANIEANAEGHFDLTWAPSPREMPKWGDLFQNHVAFVQVGDSRDWYPLDFRDVVVGVHEMLEQVPEPMRKLGKGTLLDPELISTQNAPPAVDDAPPTFPFLNMESETFAKEINADRYFPVAGSGIHNEFPVASGGLRTTAVGHGNTVVMIKPPSSFKTAYVCLDARDTEAEAKAGVPSGGGWHKIGDPAETVLNTLEAESLLFGYANAQPAAAPPSGGFAQGLSDVAVLRKLKPGSALVTATAETASGANFHWFAFQQPHEVCAVEWVHPEIPTSTNHMGFEPLWKK